MEKVPRTKNEETYVPLNQVAVAALRAQQDRGESRGRVFQPAKTEEPLEEGRGISSAKGQWKRR